MSVPSDVPIPPCSVYMEELKHCKSLSSKFQRYYADLPADDCSRWRKIYDTCVLWEGKGDEEAHKKVMAFEHDRHQQIIKNRTTVWGYRKEPPPGWMRPGEALRQKMEAHQRSVKQQKLGEEKNNATQNDKEGNS